MSLENFYLTDAGNALLARAQAGETLTFTRAQVGEGTWPAETTYANITALVAPVKYLNLTGIRTSGNQATVGVQFSNSGVGRAFNWTEFALWAADPDHPSDRSYDILYGAAYADDTPVPIPSTLTEFLFNSIVKINRAANITVTVDSSLVYIPASEKGAPGGVATLGSDGKIPAEQVPMGDLSTSEIKENLVDDDTVVITDSQANNKTKRVFWSDIKEILGGLFVPFTRKINNKALSSDVDLNAADVGASPAPNLLVNGNFAYNPRGEAQYTQVNVDTVKGWKINANGVTIIPNGHTSGGINIQLIDGHTEGAFSLVQELSSDQTAKFTGKKVILSVLVTNVAEGGETLTVFVGSRSTLAYRANTNSITAPGLYTAVLEVTEDIANKNDFCVAVRAGGTSAVNIKIQAIKLEIGEKQTLVRQDEDGGWALIPQMEFDIPINALRSLAYDLDGNFMDYPRGIGAADRNYMRSAVVGIGATSYTGWFRVGRIHINSAYKTSRTLLSVKGSASKGSGILDIVIRTESSAGVLNTSASKLVWHTLTNSYMKNRFAIIVDGNYADLYVNEGGTYWYYNISILDYYESTNDFTDPSYANIFKLERNYDLSGEYRKSITPLLTSSIGFTPEIMGAAAASGWVNGRLLVGGSSGGITQLGFPSAANSILRQSTSGGPYWTTPANFVKETAVISGTDYTTVRLRGSGLRNADTNPTANGTINWTYE